MKYRHLYIALLCFSGAAATAAELAVPMNLVDEKGGSQAVGLITVSETPYGLLFTPALTGLPTGIHGFHVHENPSCAPKEKDGKMAAAMAAGGHYDPHKTAKHAAPWGDGHLGDLPGLVIASDGTASYAVLAPRLKTLADIQGRSLMIHAGGDNHADHPAALGGGGARIACGVITP